MIGDLLSFELHIWLIRVAVIAYGNHFFLFIVAECGGAMLILFWTLLRERAKARSKPLERN